MGGNYELKLSYSKMFYQDLWILREQWFLCTYLGLKIKHIKAYLSTSFASRVFDTTADSRKAWKLHVGNSTETTVAKSSKKRPVDRQLNKHGPVISMGQTSQTELKLTFCLRKISLQSVVLYKTSEIIQDNKILVISSRTPEVGQFPYYFMSMHIERQ